MSPILRRDDGSLDPKGFELAGIDSTAQWIEAHLLNIDPRTAYGNSFDDAPHQLVVSTLLDAGLDQAGSAVIGQAIHRLLSKASALPHTPAYLNDLLLICSEVKIPDSAPWFLDILQSLMRSPNAVAQRWSLRDTRKLLISAAALQIPANTSPRTRDLWKQIILLPETATIALFAFGSKLHQQVPELQTWWSVCPDDRKCKELAQIITVAYRQDSERATSVLNEFRTQWEPSLQDAIDQQLIALGELPLFSRVELPKELAQGQRTLALLRTDESSIARIDRVLASRDITVIRSTYSGLKGLEKLHHSIVLWLHDEAPAERITEHDSSDFEELTDLLTNETKRMIFTFPLYLTEEKRKRQFVLSYGKQKEIGLLVPAQSTLITLQQRLHEIGKWNLAGILEQTVRKQGRIYCPSHYAMSEIVIQCAAHHPECGMVNTERIFEIPFQTAAASSGRRGFRRPRRVVPKELQGSDWIYLFDLGDNLNVLHDVGHDRALRDARNFRIAHDLDIPVGVGFNVYMAPWIIEADRWRTLQLLVQAEVHPLAKQLQEIGISLVTTQAAEVGVHPVSSAR
jgi:hypothetical protein